MRRSSFEIAFQQNTYYLLKKPQMFVSLSGRMEKKKILMKSKVAAPNLLRTLHSLYQFGHLCDVTVHTQHLGIQEEFLVHKAVLAASSNYFKGLFLHDDMLDTKNCTVTLQDIYTEEFTSFLEFVYTAEVEIEAEKLQRMKEIAERLECKDLLDICEEVKAEGRKGLDLSLHLKGQLCENGSQWPRVQQEENRKPGNSPQAVATPLQRRLWERQNKKKLLAGYELIEGQAVSLEQEETASPDPKSKTAKLPKCNKTDAKNRLSADIISLEKESSDSLLSQAESKEACVVIGNTLPEQWEDENSLISKFVSRTERRKSPWHVANVLPQIAREKCDESFRVTRQHQSHTELKHDANLAVRYGCDVCERRFSSHQNLRQHRLAAHSHQRGSSCVFCDKRFKRQKDTNEHIRRVHEKQRCPQACPYCNKVVGSKCGLVVHIRTHAGEKPYKCERCPAGFAQRSAYNTHVRYSMLCLCFSLFLKSLLLWFQDSLDLIRSVLKSAEIFFC